MKVVAVTGANGCLGSVVVKDLLNQGFSVKALFRVRNSLSDTFTQQGVEIIYGDLLSQEVTKSLVQGVEQVIHCAALTEEFHGQKKIFETNVTATHRLALEAVAAKVSHFIFISSTAVYGEESGIFSETDKLDLKRLRTLYSKSKFQAEKELQKLAEINPLRLTILRPTIIVGPKSSWTLNPIRLISKGIPIAPRSKAAFGNFVYVDDVAHSIILSLSPSDYAYRVFNIAGFSESWSDYYDLYAQMVGKKVKLLPKGFNLLSAIVPPLRVYFKILLEKRIYRHERAEKELGYIPKIDFLEMRQQLERNLPQDLNLKFASKVDSQTFISFESSQIIHPKTLSEIKRTIHFALANKKRIRVRGAMHSFAPLYVTSDISMDISAYQGVVEIKEDSVRVKGGTSLCDLMKALSFYGKCLPTHGAIKSQTVAGALSTGTHGCASQLGSMSSLVQEITLIDGLGNLRVISRENPEFPYVQINLGSMGVIVEVQLRIVEQVYIEESTLCGNLKELPNPQEIFKTKEYSYLFLYPWLELYTLTEFKKLSSRPKNLKYKKQKVSSLEIALGKFFVPRLQSEGIIGKTCRTLQFLKTKYTLYKKTVGELGGILAIEKVASSKEYPVWDISVAIPENESSEVLKKIIPFLKNAPGKKFITPMVQVRPQAQESSALSASKDSNVVWFELWIDKRVPHEEYENFCLQLHELLEPHCYRVHWGKNGPRIAEYLKSIYPQLSTFKEICSKLDPQQVFRSSFLEYL